MDFSTEVSIPALETIDARLANAELRIVDMERSINQCIAMLTDITEILARADNTITQVSKEVMPTIEALTSHPLLKALKFGKN